DMMIFALFFGVFVFYRGHDLETYVQSQALLNQNYGAINTLFLLASSWFVVMGVNSARERDTRAAPRFLTAAFLCALGFAVVKFLEYGEKIAAGITLTTNDFFMFYYMLTGLHFVHVIIGMVILGFLIKRTTKP